MMFNWNGFIIKTKQNKVNSSLIIDALNDQEANEDQINADK